jgi:hypothetical protein
MGGQTTGVGWAKIKSEIRKAEIRRFLQKVTKRTKIGFNAENAKARSTIYPKMWDGQRCGKAKTEGRNQKVLQKVVTKIEFNAENAKTRRRELTVFEPIGSFAPCRASANSASCFQKSLRANCTARGAHMGIVSKTAFRFLRDLAIAVILVVAVWLFAIIYTTAASRQRHAFLSHVQDLLTAHEQLHTGGTQTNYPGVYPVTNRVAASGLQFDCEFAAHLPGLTNGESLLMATDGTVLWIDKGKEPTVVRDGGRSRIAFPKGFHEE